MESKHTLPAHPTKNAEAFEKEASSLYSMIALYKTANSYADYLLKAWPKKLSIRDKLFKAVERIRSFENFVSDIGEDTELKSQWDKEWTERDYLVYGEVIGNMIKMNDEQRAALGLFSTELAEGRAIVEVVAEL